MSRPATPAASESRFSHRFEALQQLARDVLAYAEKQGATACEVDVSDGFGQSVTVRCGEVETIEYNRDKAIAVTIYLDRRKGQASTSDFSPTALRETVDAAVNIARFTAADPCAGLPEAGLLAIDSGGLPDLDLYHPWLLSVEGAVDLARRCEQAAFAVSSQISNSEGATVSIQEGQFVSANSLGFMGGYPTSRHYLSCSVIAGQSENMQRDEWYSIARAQEAIASPESIGECAAQRALARLGARKVKTCRVPVLFEAPLAPSLIGNFVHAVSGGSLYRKTSFLVDSLGKRVFSKKVRISERPHLPRSLASTYFDSDGVATHDREVVSDGRLQGYFLSAYTARKLGMQTTGNAGGCHNLIVHPGKRDFPGLLKKMGRGLLVTELLGHGVNYVTGDYSRGAAGYWIEGGEIAHPVEEITIAGNLRDMFRNVAAVGNDVLVRGSKQVGSLLIEEMKVAGE
ncbi:peptidase required for the maturation and secretion of the antibiotic peptide MccB17 [Candidatus Accumulibacter aalborgensis]|uniref:Peptidase required for the maturation and secretion of the antibiotic peptide MccB17 n=1 Tax=Candidatus Accumulibacter aalborgensis TaxID=1860102 RepID=A0A1A8XNZ0_9PROT|nr:metalloprotease PmbA [Candidatus Accumulibacter aalborgensis]SBT06880.1 peptidase required for the maturation and secretion of the antibiotic peptide MccB17 [Candidatus Accumulibacter aalborgensis]